MGWIIVLGVVAVLCIAVALYRFRTRYRRGSHERPPEWAGQWEAEHAARIENPPGGTTGPDF